MVNFVTDKNKIIELWQEAFGDSRGEILYFTDNLKNGKCIGISEVDELASMLFLVKCNFGSYIYAACTRKKYRGGGYMTQLLDYTKDNESPLCLIPASDSLVDFYYKHGFTEHAHIEDICFDECDGIKEYLLEGYSLTDPQVMIYKEV